METIDEVQRGYRNIAVGTLWVVGGSLVTAISYAAAVSAGGGHYVLAWGAIVFGGLQVFRGFAQSLSKVETARAPTRGSRVDRR